ncbi:hypothetical protein RJ639_007383 [Escallonia herrerae]|uniref:Uncharacterized protein n=1 Tax=Escallonia herrerae TaxID=1293975 RepID=A0AA88VXG2_9ASTE|nr:hypothetical protein RJ639_007383 [Escallonia herrerae]
MEMVVVVERGGKGLDDILPAVRVLGWTPILCFQSHAQPDSAQKATFLSGHSLYFHALGEHMLFCHILFSGNHHLHLLKKPRSTKGQFYGVKIDCWADRIEEIDITIAAGLGLIVYAGLANADVWKEFYQYFRESKFIHVTCIGFTLLSAFAPFWVYNDMTVRKWYDKGFWLLPVSVIPLLLGPSLSLLPVSAIAPTSPKASACFTELNDARRRMTQKSS